MIKDIERIKTEATSEIASAGELTALEELRVKYLGKKGLVTGLLQKLGKLEPDERRSAGQAVNAAKTTLHQAFEDRKVNIRRESLEKELSLTPSIDVTLPGQFNVGAGSKHPISMVIEEIVTILKKIGFSVASGPEIELEYYNFEALNTPESHPARDMQDTFYVNGPTLLRSHTSSVQIRAMEKHPPPIQFLSIGRVYRSDYDATHTPMFHQCEGLMVDRKISFADLKGVTHHFVKELFGNRKIRFRPSYFPFTEPSAEIDIQWNRGKGEPEWLEIGGCGMVHPNVFKSVNYDSEEFTGFAFGMGIERIAMLKYGINDLRSFFENDYRMLEQF